LTKDSGNPLSIRRLLICACPGIFPGYRDVVMATDKLPLSSRYSLSGTRQ
jgi:hypothetical protein